MSILTSASSSSVSRGYDCYNRNKVNNVRQLNDHEFEGYVDGSLKMPYYVKIDIEHPRLSYCDCPHANGNITCKHMIALYFELFPNEVDDYESWLNSDYDEDEEDNYDYYDEYDGGYYDYDDDDYSDYNELSKFQRPLFFDVVLEKYVDDLSIDNLKKILLTELKNNEKRTYELYLENNYIKYLQNDDEDLIFLDKLNKKVQNLIEESNYNYDKFDDVILSLEEKKKIQKLYTKENLRPQIEKILFNVKLAVYSDYKWIALFYKYNKNEYEIDDFSYSLEKYLDELKHCSIKNSIPKSNILIIIYLLNDFSVVECANSMLKNAKYLQYIDYIVKNNSDILNLYKEFMKLIEKNYFKNKIYIPDILYRFVSITNYENNDINMNHNLYSYLCLGELEYLDNLQYYLSENEIIRVIENKTKDIFLLIKLYKYAYQEEKLWNILINSNYRYLLLDNIQILKDKYNEQLYNHFINEFYNILNQGKNRGIYNKASKYINAISKLNNGKKLVEEILIDLKKSNYQRCSALFDEINNAIKHNL